MRFSHISVLLLIFLPVAQAITQPGLWGPAHVTGNIDTSWYVDPMIRYANYVTDAELLQKDKITADKASQYLYDRPRALTQLFLLTGDTKWKQEAIAASQFYLARVADDGYFSLVDKKDVKYLMPRGLLYYYQLTSDESARRAINRIYLASLDWNPEYRKRGFWTERNQAAALEAALSYYELTNDAKALQRIEQILNATLDMVISPANGWPQRGCPQHTFKAHEGGTDESAVCSPWMLALLADPIWRFHQLTQSDKAEKLLRLFGRFILEHGTYPGKDKFEGQQLPKYLVVFDNAQMEDINPWNDMQHSCDVAALLGKALYFEPQIPRQSAETFFALLAPCKNKASRLKDKKPYWRVRPPRKFGWEYSTTSDLPWLEQIVIQRQSK